MRENAEVDRRPGGIQVINRAARILRSLRDEPEGLSLGQIAGRVALPRSTVQRIVTALAAEGLLMAAKPSGRMRLGTEIVALAATSRFDTVDIAHPHLKALAEATGETVDLAVLHNDHLIFVDQVIGSHRLRAVSGVGEIFPLHSTANGKACLALMSDAEIDRVLPRSLPPLAGGRVRSIKAFLKEIEEVRRSGVAFDEEEHTQGISALGVALRDRVGMVYAISMPVPTTRFTEDRVRLQRQLLDTLARLKTLLGG